MIKDPGFSLVELLVVVAIISVLTAVVVPLYQKFRMRVKRSDAYITLTAAHKSQISYFSGNDRFYSPCDTDCNFWSESSTDNVKNTNEYLGLGIDLDKTKMGYLFYWSFENGRKSYFLTLGADLDPGKDPTGDPYTDFVLIHVEHSLFAGVPQQTPIVGVDDITNHRYTPEPPT